MNDLFTINNFKAGPPIANNSKANFAKGFIAP